MKPYTAFIPFVNRIDLLQRAILGAAYFTRDLHLCVIDNSPELLYADEYAHNDMVMASFPEVPLFFSQTMNFMIRQSAKMGDDFFIWIHSDAVPAEGSCEALVEKANYLIESSKPWGALFTNYDAMSAINMKAVKAVGDWDQNLIWYLSDCDYYRRLRLAGFPTIETNLSVYHDPSQTLNADSKIANAVKLRNADQTLYYTLKWGGLNGEEIFTTPFNSGEKK
jgi:hypothetical protein